MRQRHCAPLVRSGFPRDVGMIERLLGVDLSGLIACNWQAQWKVPLPVSAPSIHDRVVGAIESRFCIDLATHNRCRTRGTAGTDSGCSSGVCHRPHPATVRQCPFNRQEHGTAGRVPAE